MRRLWLACLVASLGCASAPLRPPDLQALEEADRLVLQGCYDCLLDAQRTYVRLAVARARPLVLDRLFDVTVLLALRERELARDWTPALSAARALAAELTQGGPGLPPPHAASADHPSLGGGGRTGPNWVLSLVEAVPPDAVGMPNRDRSMFLATRDAFARTLDAEVQALSNIPASPSAPLRSVTGRYLALALDCAYRSGASAPLSARESAPADPPLLAYRAAACELTQPVLYRLREGTPRFVDASIFLAQFDLAVAEQRGPGRARERLAEAVARFPDSPRVAVLSGNYFRFVADCEQAIREYDRAIALQPGHEQARLGRIMCQSYLDQHAAAVTSATVMIDGAFDFLADAYYWRAWNQRELGALDRARADIDAARRHSVTMQILTLAGMIEHDQDDLDPAERDLTVARRPPEGANNCVAMMYLGSVLTKRKAHAPASRQFEDAMDCAERAAAHTRGKLREMQARPDVDPVWLAGLTVRLEQTIAESMTQFHASALQAATAHASAGNIAAARRLVAIAAKDPALAEPVARLQDWLKNRD
jgi:hypothetical protein